LSKKVFFTVDNRIQELVEEIKTKKGYRTYTQVWTQAMIEFHGRTFKDYVLAQANKPKREPKTPEDRVKEMEETAEAKRKSAENQKLAIAEKLGAKIIDHGDGDKTVQWFVYHSSGKDLQEMPLMMLTDDLVHNQFMGNIKKIKEFHQLK